MNLDFIKPILIPINKEGHKFIAIFFAITVFFYLLDFTILTFIGLVLTIWCAAFFRDPVRFTPTQDGLIISPADGVVQMITEATPPAELNMDDEKLTRVSIFMNIFNVHVNRSPISGKIKAVEYKAGNFFNADLDKSSQDNERQSFIIEHKNGTKVAFVQIAGLVARRIKTYVQPDDVLSAGERFGLIRFGSRVDVYLPKGIKSKVSVGQTVIAGESIIANFIEKQQNECLCKSD
jgi:phosphatidylserine decarboxylase